eukprot:4611236-Karenia_brevis.AAC.1
MAVLKRASVLVNTKSQWILKLADAPEIHVYDIPSGGSYLKPGSADILEQFFIRGVSRTELSAKVDEEQHMLQQILTQ